MALIKIQKLKMSIINKINFVIQKNRQKFNSNQAWKNIWKFYKVGFTFQYYLKILVLTFNMEKNVIGIGKLID